MSEPLVVAPLATLADYDVLERDLEHRREKDPESWFDALRRQAYDDLYAFMRFVLSTGLPTNAFPNGERFICHPFAYEMARAAQFDYDGVMTMAGRGHGKSITYDFALTQWLYIRNPTWRFCIWSVTRALAKSHLRAIRNEIESNRLLRVLWPDLFYHGKPRNEAATWSLDDGLAMPLLPALSDSQTFEAWGLVDQAFPTGHHFHHMCFDDVVDARCITTPEMIAQARATHDMAGGVEMPGGCSRTYVGTPYADGDTGIQLIEEGVVRLRARPAVDAARTDTDIRRQLGGAPVMLTEDVMLRKQREMGKDYWSQMCLDPNKGRKGTLDVDQIRYYRGGGGSSGGAAHAMRWSVNPYLLVDPNGGLDPTENDRMALVVFGLGGDRNFYLLDGWIGHMNPSERQRFIIEKRAEWMPVSVRIEEKTGQVESYWLREAMETSNNRFEVESISPRSMKKGASARGHYDRVARLTDAWEPVLAEKRLYLPEDGIWIDTDDGRLDVAEAFKEELRRFPIAKSDHLISAGALLFEDHGGKRGAQPLVWPNPMMQQAEKVSWPGQQSMIVNPRSLGSGSSSWMTRGSRHVN